MRLVLWSFLLIPVALSSCDSGADTAAFRACTPGTDAPLVVPAGTTLPELVAGSMSSALHYPRDEVDAGRSGTVAVRVVVEADGRACEAAVTHSASPVLDRIAVDAVEATTFVPGRRNGREVAVRGTFDVSFLLVPVGGGGVPVQPPSPLPAGAARLGSVVVIGVSLPAAVSDRNDFVPERQVN